MNYLIIVVLERNNMKNNKVVTGIFAHVDAGKTTLAEAMLYVSGNIRNMGRVDNGNAFLDNYELERKRGITIFSKQAQMQLNTKKITRLDTPGHVDFSSEMERTLQVLDYAILVISGADGVQGHVQTIWKLLKMHRIPVFLFVNKMDQSGTDKAALLEELKSRLDANCMDFTCEKQEEFYETLAMCEDSLLDEFINEGKISNESVRIAIANRNVFPCYFGSALKLDGVQDFLDAFDDLSVCRDYGEEFGARVYKISRDNNGTRLTHLKVTGGSLKVKDSWNDKEKIDQIRLYSGASYTTVQEVVAGDVCAVTGLESTYCGEGIGKEIGAFQPFLEPVLTYQIRVPEETDIHTFFAILVQLEEEEPELHIVWDKEMNQIHVQVMGEVHLEILAGMIRERYGLDVTFDEGSIIYQETIKDTVEGCGHYEPLRHYAEVRLLLEPGEPGSGLQFVCNCSEDILDKNWQRLIHTHLQEKVHRGVLTGAPITDMKISLLNGKAHQKHTEGGDFRQATYRAVRQGLKKAESVLLEPVYEYQLEIPADSIGRAMADLQRMKATFDNPTIQGDMAVLKGFSPVINMRNYQQEVVAYTKGYGRLFCVFAGYRPCHNAEEIIANSNYNSESDLNNPTGSVFCSHGAGFVVPWDEVDSHMHTTSPRAVKKEEFKTIQFKASSPVRIDEDELKAIFERTYGASKQERKNYASKRVEAPTHTTKTSKPKYDGPEYLLVDGYNIIFAWPELKDLAMRDMTAARDKLMDILCNYQGFKNNVLILVFDAYKVPGNIETYKYHNIYVVYTKEAETADQYIEKTVHEIGRKHHVTVATSDSIEQIIIMGQGAMRLRQMVYMKKYN